MRILYVEDNEVNQALVERVLRAKQCTVVFREEGEGALDVLTNDQAIDLILLDIELAGSMSGLDVIRTMRAGNDNRPVVAITAYAMMGDRERFLEAGCDQYLPKPLVITDLLNLLDQYEADFAAKAARKTGEVKAQTVTAPAAPESVSVESTPAEPTAAPAETALPEPAAATVTETAAPEPATTATVTETAASEPTPPAAPAAAESVSAPASAPPATVPTDSSETSTMPTPETATPVADSESAPASSPPEASQLTANEPANPSATKDAS